MNIYDIMFDYICEKYNQGIISYEDAELLNNTAYNRYMSESKLEYYKNYMGSDEKTIRKIDDINKDLKKGKITDDERKEKVIKLINGLKESGKDKTASIVKYPFDGTEHLNVNYNRPNKDKPTSNGLKRSSEDESVSIINGSAEKPTAEKLKFHQKICLTTDDYNEYKQHFRTLSKLLKFNNPSAMRVSYGAQLLANIFHNKPANLKPGTILYHTSDVKNLNRLNGTFRSKDGVLYATKRVYFHVGKPGGRNSTDFDKGNVYVYDGDISKARIDTEFPGSSAVYIETDTSVPVRKLETKEPKKEIVEKRDIK